MRTTLHALHRPAQVGWLQAAASALSRAWTAHLERRTRRAAVLVLQSLDEHTLQDMGINRSEIESVVYGPPVERKRHYSGGGCW
jgi:uncharacterized protein YjiS (DUF1127 family)